MDCFRRPRERCLCGRCGATIVEPKKHQYLIFGALWFFCDSECFTVFIRNLVIPGET